MALAKQLAGLAGATDLIVLPEMFTTGFSMEPRPLAESIPGPTLSWMQEQAAHCQAAITGSIICSAEGKYYNRLIWMRPDGTYATYDKRHLFAYAGEDAHYTAGTERLIVTLGPWTICPLICYDLRFPVWSRNTEPVYDVLIYLANWPSPRRTAWQKLLQARAIENQAYVVGVNRVGTDANGFHYQGDSCVVDFLGDPVFEGQEGRVEITTTIIQREPLQEYRAKFPFLASAGKFQIL
jgi:omega-amidase